MYPAGEIYLKGKTFSKARKDTRKGEINGKAGEGEEQKGGKAGRLRRKDWRRGKRIGRLGKVGKGERKWSLLEKHRKKGEEN